MSEKKDDNEVDPGFVPSEERIKELNEIDRDISKVLNLASQAIALLPNDEHDDLNPKLDDVKEDFENMTQDYYKLLNRISVVLQRQVYGLEEAGLITKGTRYDADRAASMNEDQSGRRGGGGPLDSSWLNARAKDAVGQAMRQEILAEAKEFLKKSNIDIQQKEGDSMDVDSNQS